MDKTPEKALDASELERRVNILSSTVKRLRRENKGLRVQVNKLQEERKQLIKNKKPKFRNKRTGFHGY